MRHGLRITISLHNEKTTFKTKTVAYSDDYSLTAKNLKDEIDRMSVDDWEHILKGIDFTKAILDKAQEFNNLGFY